MCWSYVDARKLVDKKKEQPSFNVPIEPVPILIRIDECGGYMKDHGELVVSDASMLVTHVCTVCHTYLSKRCRLNEHEYECVDEIEDADGDGYVVSKMWLCKKCHVSKVTQTRYGA